MESSPFSTLPNDIIHKIFSDLPLRQIIICRSVCKSLFSTLSSPAFLHTISVLSPHPRISLSLIALRPSHRSYFHLSPNPTLHAFDPCLNQWLRFPLSFLPFPSILPITSSHGLLYLWASGPSSPGPNSSPSSSSSSMSNNNNKILIVCNPLTREFKALPQLGSAWSRHGSVLIGREPNQVLVLTELATLYSTSNSWLKFSSNLPSKPRSPVLMDDCVLALCDVGSPWRSQWKLFKSSVTHREQQFTQKWTRLEKREWGDVFDIIKRPRLIMGGKNKVLMIGGLKSSYSLHSACSTILILRLDLENLEWDEAGRMPLKCIDFFQIQASLRYLEGGIGCAFQLKGSEDWLFGELIEENDSEKSEWRWIDGVPGNGDGLCRGFIFEAQLTAVP